MILVALQTGELWNVEKNRNYQRKLNLNSHAPESTGYQDIYCSTTIKSDLVVSQCEGGNGQTWLTDGWIWWLDGGINMNMGLFHVHALVFWNKYLR